MSSLDSIVKSIVSKVRDLDLVMSAKFVVVGIVGFIVNFLGLRFLVNTFGLNYIVSEVISTILALQITFIFHNYWTYNSINGQNEHYQLSTAKRYIAFISSNSVGSLLTIGSFAITSVFINSHFVALGLAAVLGTTWNYFANLYLTWKKEKNTTTHQTD